MQMEHEDFIVVFEQQFAVATVAQKQQFLLEMGAGTDEQRSFESVLECFEDTRSEQEVNDMLRAFPHIGMHGWTWSDEEEQYTQK